MSITHSVDANAALCVVQTSDPRYNVASYVRNQTSCKTTQYANSADVTGKLVVAIAAVFLINKFIDYIQSEQKKEEFVNALKADPNAKVYQCKTVDVITANNTSYVGMNGRFEELPKLSNTAYQRRVEEGIIRFDLDRNMMLVQRWTEKTARGGACEYKGLLRDL
jgi:hypothetical protein